MPNNMVRQFLCGELLLTALLLVLSCSAMAQQYRSPSAVAGDTAGTTLYVSEYGSNTVAVFDGASKTVARRIELPLAPEGLALSPDGKTLYIAGASSDGALLVADVATGAVTARVPTGHTPVAVVVSPAGDRVFVANRFDNTVAVVDPATNSVLSKIPVPREPVAMTLAAGGALLFVANHLPAGASDGDYTSAGVTVIDTVTLEAAPPVPLPNGSTALRGICPSPGGEYVYVAHILGRYHLPTTQLERGWMNTNALSILDAKEKRLINTVLLDDVDLGAANPSAVACTPDGRFLCVTHAGTHELSILDRASLHDRLAQLNEKDAAAVPNNLAFLVGLRTRVKLPGIGPRALWLDNTKAYVPLYFSDSITEVPLESQGKRDIIQTALSEAQAITPERQGEIYFNDAALCFQHWQSCASCHPDARVDGLNWDLMNDGIGNPKNSRSMLLSHQTPPVMALGVRDQAELAVRAGIKYIQFAVRPEEDAVAIDRYLKSMKPVPSPQLEGGALSEAATRGKEVFSQAGCAVCHPEPLFTDLKLHNLGFTKGLDEGKPVDTPTLVEVWRTAPYLHDGRAATLHDLLTTCNTEDRHGKTSGLSAEQLDDLVAYVLSL
ncbi:MAG TPA: c-type cytochrome [Candidatus Hydrogenedentes bacterium]|nr:beta-propeller fold lactonase family protein [Candidatus Hydrogenedentota bacterium]HOC67241.1 c-type cytochrome [Candidatus Hydrogenedentota bacterium]